MEKDDEVKGDGNHLSFNDYGLDTRLGRRWNIDPLSYKFPYESTYSVFKDGPILYLDPTGKSGTASLNEKTKTITITSIYVFYGSGSTPELAKQIASNIQNEFNDAHGTVKIDGVDYNVEFKIIGVDANTLLSKYDDKAKEKGMEQSIKTINLLVVILLDW